MAIENTYFIRVNGLMNAYQNLCRRYYSQNKKPISIPSSVFQHSANLIPLSEVYRFYEEVEKDTKDEDFIIPAIDNFRIDDLGGIGNWMFLERDLMSTIRKVNYGMASIQSGAFWVAAPAGNIIRWSYRNICDTGNMNVNDSLRVAVFMLKVLRYYLGDSFIPMQVLLSGEKTNKSFYDEYFNCQVKWNHPQTEVWFHAEFQLISHQEINRRSLSINVNELDYCLNMPLPGDDTKLVYEMINYTCHFGLPTLARVSGLLGLSPQQFQRRFHKYGHNFSEMCGYVLSNKAIRLLNSSNDIEGIARTLGYKSVDSFIYMFKKNRGITPFQYLKYLETD
ncbi:helix-turn-helix domain-containing protein [Vibrio mediterranei]|uniref:helix-turn-helix domain-containing protein n=1 Tax=Vibrio mediterranei TaxID=689 RepID=UPI0040679C89